MIVVVLVVIALGAILYARKGKQSQEEFYQDLNRFDAHSGMTSETGPVDNRDWDAYRRMQRR